MMKKAVICLSVGIVMIMIMISVVMISGKESAAASPKLPEEAAVNHVVEISSRVLPYRDIDEIYSTCDYIVLATVTSMSDSYLYNRTFDPNGDEPIAEQLRHLRTPYEVEIIEVFKGDEAITGDTMTVFTTGGTYAGYIVETSFPELEVGNTYILPVVDFGDDQNLVIQTAMAEIDDELTASVSSVNSNGSAQISASMFDSTWEGIDTIADLRDEIDAIKENAVE